MRAPRPRRAGKLYVVDVSDRKLRVFDADGNELYVLGGTGKGPGELMFPHPIAVAGDHVVVNDRTNGRLSVWDIEGNFVEDHAHGRRFDLGLLEGLPDGSLLAMSAEQDETGTWLSVVARYSPAGEQIGRWATFPTFGLTLMKPGPDIEASSAAAYNEGVIESSKDRQLAAGDTLGQAYVIERGGDVESARSRRRRRRARSTCTRPTASCCTRARPRT